MPYSQKMKRKEIRVDNLDVDHPFLHWLTSYHRAGAVTAKGYDIKMTELASKRFSLGVDADGSIFFGLPEDDLEAFLSVQWSKAFFLRYVEKKDWVAFMCKDIRPEGALCDEPIKIRLWLPCTKGLLDGWAKTEVASIKIIETFIRKGKPHPKSETPIAVLPLKKDGVWPKNDEETKAT